MTRAAVPASLDPVSAPAASVRADHRPVTGRAGHVALVAICGGLAVMILAVGASSLAVLLQDPLAMRQYGAVDFTLYRDVTSRWLSGGAFYEPYQVAGHYNIVPGAVLYPPVALLLFIPFTFLPAFLWWLIPLGLMAWAIVRLRPHPLAWPVMAGCLSVAIIRYQLVAGNPVMWIAAAFAVGCVVTGPAVLVLLKPSLFPFALMGVNRRGWWIALGLFALACLPFALMWVDWIRTLLNSDGTLGYSSLGVWWFAIPLVAWAGRPRELIEATRERS